MADGKSAVLVCVICQKQYPVNFNQCPEDEGSLVVKYESDALIGQMFAGKYEIISLLGEGGMSRVYKARHRYMKRDVAVKVMHENAVDDELARARFQREAEAASKLSHPNVVIVHDFGITKDGRAFFIMDCLEGPTLDKILAERKFLAVEEAIGIFEQALDGLAHAHYCGVVHRDIKPSNLVISKKEDGSALVKLVDFGIAKIIGPAEEKKQARLTKAGQIFGTACYMSPEQCSGAELDERSDLYSFGCLMYETLAGEPPFVGPSFIATVAKHVSEQALPLSAKAQIDVPADIESVVMKCLEKKAENRFANAVELKQALLNAAGRQSPHELRISALHQSHVNLGLSNYGTVKGRNKAMTQSQRVRQTQQRNWIAILSLFISLLAFAAWSFFCYRGPLDDYGSLYDKFRWQCGIADADTYMRMDKVEQAIDTLRDCEKIASEFGDDKQRLELTLKKLQDAYTADRNEQMVVKVNAELLEISHKRTDLEFTNLLNQLKQWELGEIKVRGQALAIQAVSVAERISRCADKLSLYSPHKEEALLNRAIKVYDILNLPQGIYRMRFRMELAELYLEEDRLNSQLQMLEEAKTHASANPSSEEAWWLKAKVSQMLGITYSNNSELDKAKRELDLAVSICRQHVSDRNLLRDCLNSSAQVYRKFHKSEYDAIAEQSLKEAKEIALSLEKETEK